MTHNDPQSLARQYGTDHNLSARIRLHERFSTNTYGWFPWVFDQFAFPPAARVLELGCGPASLWVTQRARIPASWQVTLTDFSAGMLEKAGQALGGLEHFSFQQLDANERLPFADGTFDVVIANHMLYHVGRRAELLREIRRVLAPDGVLVASTVGENHLIEISALMRQFDPACQEWEKVSAPFTLENGLDQLRACFAQVELRRYEDALEVNEAGPLVEYILSGWAETVGERVPALRALIEKEMAAHGGGVHITKDSGLFIARG